jgi:hypothetical protein
MGCLNRLLANAVGRSQEPKSEEMAGKEPTGHPARAFCVR